MTVEIDFQISAARKSKLGRVKNEDIRKRMNLSKLIKTTPNLLRACKTYGRRLQPERDNKGKDHQQHEYK